MKDINNNSTLFENLCHILGTLLVVKVTTTTFKDVSDRLPKEGYQIKRPSYFLGPVRAKGQADKMSLLRLCDVFPFYTAAGTLQANLHILFVFTQSGHSICFPV